MPEIEYRPPTHAALIAYGFHPFSFVSNNEAFARVGTTGGTVGIWVFDGYKGSPKIELVYLSHGEFSLGPPESKERPKVFKAANGHEFEAALFAAGYPSKEQKAELAKAYEKKQQEQYSSDCDFINMMNAGRVNKKPLPKSPKEEERLYKTWLSDCERAKNNKRPLPICPQFNYFKPD